MKYIGLNHHVQYDVVFESRCRNRLLMLFLPDATRYSLYYCTSVTFVKETDTRLRTELAVRKRPLESVISAVAHSNLLQNPYIFIIYDGVLLSLNSIIS
jgi:hypothetical protein